MTVSNTTYLNVGIYTLPEASRLAGVSRERIGRWMRGYRSSLRQKNYTSLWNPQLPVVDHKLALGFLDLIEVKFVGTFLDNGVSWPMIHKVREKARELYPNVSHPMCTKQFVTDGRQLFMDVHSESGEFTFLEMTSGQQVFGQLPNPFLAQLEFKEGAILQRWWPLGRDGQIMLDPRKNFGQPTLVTEGIATRILAESFRANGSIAKVASWHDISPEAVQSAVDYEQSLSA